jgi:hypothetical protein
VAQAKCLGNGRIQHNSLLEPSFQAKAKRACFVEAVREWLLVCAGKGKTLDVGDNKLENKDLIAAAVTVLYRSLPHYLCPTATLLQIPLLTAQC